MAKASQPSSKKSKTENPNIVKPSWLRRIMVTLLKLTIVFGFVITLYAIYLDAKVRNTFEGNRWQVPVQVFSQVETLKKGQLFNLPAFAKSLTYAGYKRVTTVKNPGEYALSRSRINVFQRTFDQGRQYIDPFTYSLSVSGSRINELLKNHQQVKQLTLAPHLIDRLVPQTKEDRVLVALEKTPEQLVDTLLLVEDRDYYFHSGVSPLGILRALYQNIKAGRTVQGGSTLTQQLVKNMFLTRNKTIWRKVNEAIMALILEYRYSKDQLLEAYLNEVYLGQHYANGIYGFGLAAEFYFGENLQALSVAQIAMLVGQVKGPSYYDPWRYPQNTLKRRDLVLGLMFKHDLISRQNYETAIESPLGIRKSRRLVKQKYPAYLQVVQKELKQHLSLNEQQSGIRVFTGFSLYQQVLLEKAVDEKVSELSKKSGEENLEAAMIITDIATGELSAIIGGKNKGYAGFNRAVNASRPIGSLIKPLIYLAALERYQRFNLASVLEDKKITLTSGEHKQWQPKNYDGKYRGQVLLIDALVQSLNIPTVNLGMELGLENIANTLHLVGIDQDITLRPSLLLGSLNLSPLDVTQMYLPLANGGNFQQVHAVTHIVNEQGITLFEFEPQQQPLFSAQASYLIDHALNKVTTEGTARSLAWRVKNQRLAGKTGTTNDQRDSWFVGFDQQHLITTWLGHDDNSPTSYTGSSGALVMFAEMMNKIGVEYQPPLLPENIAQVNFERSTGQAVTHKCEDMAILPAITTSLVFEAGCQKPLQEKKNWFERLFGE